MTHQSMATIENPAPNWEGFRWKDSDANSDRAVALTEVMCFIGNKEILAIAEAQLLTIKQIDSLTDSERISCADYRSRSVKTYNLMREHLITRKSQGRYRGELLELLDFIPGVRN